MPSSTERPIDLNVDLAEGADDAPLYPLISSANIACGGHAGDATTMAEAVDCVAGTAWRSARIRAIPDRARFGRVTMSMAAPELARAIAEQTALLRKIADELGAPLSHVKPHGALYNDAAHRPDVAAAIADGIRGVDASLVLYGLAGSSALDVWRQRGYRVAAEGFADRGYAKDGALVPRGQPGALLTDPAAARTQGVRLAWEGRCETLCVHADTPGAAAIVAAVRAGLEQAGFAIRSVKPG